MKLTHFSFSKAWIHYLFPHKLLKSRWRNTHHLSANMCRKRQEIVVFYIFGGNASSLNIKNQNPLSYLKGSYSITLVCWGSAAANTCLISRERGSAMSFSFLKMKPVSATANLTKESKTYVREKGAVQLTYQQELKMQNNSELLVFSLFHFKCVNLQGLEGSLLLKKRNHYLLRIWNKNNKNDLLRTVRKLIPDIWKDIHFCLKHWVVKAEVETFKVQL